jgi:proteasome accessory factor B
MRRIERLINLIAALLETPRPLTADEIRDRIAGYGDEPTADAFRRAFERDKEDLRRMGVPIEVRPTGHLGGDPDGYLIPKDDYYLPELLLEPDELAALRIAAGALLGGMEEAEAGLLKLSVDETSAAVVAPRIAYGADVAAEEPALVSLYAAVLQLSPVAFTYRRADGDVSRREVRPYSLVHRRGHWYLVGWDEQRDDVRGFKVSRIQGPVETMQGSYEIPEGFNGSQHLVEAWELGEERPVDVVVRFDPDVRWWPEQNMSDARLEEGPEGRLDVIIAASNLDAVVSWVVGFGDRVEIVSPPAARDHLMTRLRPYLENAG